MARVNGYRVTDLGQLRVSTGKPPTSWLGGLPFDENGDLIGDPNPPVDTDPYVGGVRVSSTGVCMTALPLPP